LQAVGTGVLMERLRWRGAVVKFAPVRLPEDRRPLGRAHADAAAALRSCARSGYLYLLHRGEARTAEMERGRALHAVAERMVRLAIENGEVTVPAEVVKAEVDAVLADPSFNVPVSEHDRIREMAYRLAEETAVDPGAVVSVETLFVLDVVVPCPECGGGS
jgi:hypothetical protein